MPAVPEKHEKLAAGQYNMKIIGKKTNPAHGDFSAQEEVEIAVLDEAWNDTKRRTRTWLSHSSFAAYAMFKGANLLEETTDANGNITNWEIKVPSMFVGVVTDGKIKAMVRA